MPFLKPKERVELGKKIRAAREKKKLTQAQVSSKIAQHFFVIGQLERGEPTRLSPAALKKICQFLEVDYE